MSNEVIPKKRYRLIYFSLVLSFIFHAGVLYYLQNHKYLFNQGGLSLASTAALHQKKKNTSKLVPTLPINFSSSIPLVQEEKKEPFPFMEKEASVNYFYATKTFVKKDEQNERIFPKEMTLSQMICSSTLTFPKTPFLKPQKPLNETRKISYRYGKNNVKKKPPSSPSAKIENTKRSNLSSDSSIAIKESKSADPFKTISPSPVKQYIQTGERIFSTSCVKNATALLSSLTLSKSQKDSLYNQFDMDLSYVYDEEEKVYIFAASILPSIENTLPKLDHHYFFLLDRSNSIQNERLTFSRQAVVSSLGLLDPQDKFTVYAFDNSVEFLTAAPEENTHALVNRAMNFLLKQKVGSFVLPTNYCAPLLSAFHAKQKDAVCSVIMFTNGQECQKPYNLDALYRFSLSQEMMRLFPVVIQGDQGQSVLEYISHLNNGKTVVSATQRGQKRHLQKLLKSLQTPIAYNLETYVSTAKKENPVEILSSKKKGILFKETPYTIIGKMSKLEDITLFVQGRTKEEYFTIKKNLSFSKAKKGGQSLKKEYALMKAYSLYDQYINGKNPMYLQKAHTLLTQYGMEKPF